MPAPTLDPVRLRVLLSLQTALASMSVATGYHWDVSASAVTLDYRNLSTAVTLPAFVVAQAGDDTREFLPANRIKDQFRVMVFGRVDAKGLSDQNRRVTAFEYLAADIERAFSAEITRGGLAVDTRVQPPREPFIEMDPVNSVYIEQPVEIILRRMYGRPEWY